MKYEILVQIGITTMVVCIIGGVAFLILAQMSFMYGELPPLNSTEEWKEILGHNDTCKLWDLGCQKLACVIDCQEINRNAGENICVC